VLGIPARIASQWESTSRLNALLSSLLMPLARVVNLKACCRLMSFFFSCASTSGPAPPVDDGAG